MASQVDIGIELQRLLDTLPPPRGIKFDKAFPGYVEALKGFEPDHIHEAITRFFAAEYPELSPKWYPRAPELASIVRKVRSVHAAEAERLRRAQQLAADRAEMAAVEERMDKTPEQLARAAKLYADFCTDHAKLSKPPAGVMSGQEQAEVRARYGMTDEVLAKIKNRPLPKGMKQLEAPPIAKPPALDEHAAALKDL